MDIQIIRQVLEDAAEALRTLGTDTEETALLERIRAALGRLPENRIGRHGQLMEWNKDYDEPEPGHRHISHLFGLYPAAQISPTKTSALAEASRITLDRRLAKGGGHTGWSRAWLICFFARLGDGASAWRELSLLWAKSTLPNLLDTHPPFQIDGNFGATAAIAEMLLQSHAGEIHLLPALPESWRQGNFRGFRARGGISVDADWSNGNLKQVVLRSSEAITIRVRAPHGQALVQWGKPVETAEISLDPNHDMIIEGTLP